MSDLTPENSNTSPEILEAIAKCESSRSSREIWEDPTEAEALSIWERVTKNGLLKSTDFFWGAAEEHWAAALGIDA